MHEYEITCIAPGTDAAPVRELADKVYDALLLLDGYAELGETNRIENGGWTAALEYAVVLADLTARRTAG